MSPVRKPRDEVRVSSHATAQTCCSMKVYFHSLLNLIVMSSVIVNGGNPPISPFNKGGLRGIL